MEEAAPNVCNDEDTAKESVTTKDVNTSRESTVVAPEEKIVTEKRHNTKRKARGGRRAIPFKKKKTRRVCLGRR